MKRMMPECRSQMPPEGEKEKSGLHTPLPGCVFSLHVLRNSEVKWMSTSQKKRRTLLPFQKRAPTSSPFPRENSPFSWMKVKFLKLAALKGKKDTVSQASQVNRVPWKIHDQGPSTSGHVSFVTLRAMRLPGSYRMTQTLQKYMGIKGTKNKHLAKF